MKRRSLLRCGFIDSLQTCYVLGPSTLKLLLGFRGNIYIPYAKRERVTCPYSISLENMWFAYIGW